MRENALQKQCILWVRQNFHHKLLITNVHGSGYTNKGFPDLIVFGKSRAIVVELKSADTGYEPQPDQIIWRQRFLDVGVPHYFCNSFAEFKEIITKEFDLDHD